MQFSLELRRRQPIKSIEDKLLGRCRELECFRGQWNLGWVENFSIRSLIQKLCRVLSVDADVVGKRGRCCGESVGRRGEGGTRGRTRGVEEWLPGSVLVSGGKVVSNQSAWRFSVEAAPRVRRTGNLLRCGIINSRAQVNIVELVWYSTARGTNRSRNSRISKTVYTSEALYICILTLQDTWDKFLY